MSALPLTDTGPVARARKAPLRDSPAVRQLARFAAVGAVSTIAFSVLFVLLRGVTGPQVANLLSLLLTALANTAANRRITFGVRGSSHLGRHHGRGLAVFGVGLALTSGSLALLDALTADASREIEVAVLCLANLVATLVRFTLMRLWVFADGRAATGSSVVRR